MRLKETREVLHLKPFCYGEGHIPRLINFAAFHRKAVAFPACTLTARYHPHGSPGVDDSLGSC